MEIFAQIIGVVAMTLGIFSFQAKESSKILMIQTVANCIWATHYLLLGNAAMGVVLNIYSAIRNVVYYFLNKKENDKNVKIATITLLVVCCILGIVFYQNVWSIFPVIGSLVQAVSFSFKNANRLRALTLIASPCWLTYNVASGSLGGTLTETFVICSILIGLWRYRKKEE